MSKIVKYCNSCEEGFAEKFGFCPNCGSQLEAFAMNPVGGIETAPVKPVEEIKPDKPKNEIIIPAETAAENYPSAAFEQPIAAPPIPVKAEIIPETAAPGVEPIREESAFLKPNIIDEKPKVDEKPKARSAAAGVSAPVTQNFQTPAETPLPKADYKTDRGYYVTVVEEKNAKQRNQLLLGAMAAMIVLLLGSWVYSLLNKSFDLTAIDQGDLIASVPDLTPAPVDEVPPPKKEKTDGGGGGGGGKNQQEDPSKGRLPPQVKDPITPPDPNIVQMTHPELELHQQTKGNNPRQITDENTGVPNGLSRNGSSGRGSGGGIGNGFGTGVGNGRGTGEGNGIGSGTGNGTGNGTGDGTGDGGRRTPAPPPPPSEPKPAGPTKSVVITSKPRANYTDAARQANITGNVTLKVTFLANGSIGSVSAVSGLPSGLTEQAIAAAKGIRFEPAMKNGVPQTVTKSVVYSFTIY